MIERKPFGRTGHSSTRVLFGGASLARVSQRDADATLEILLEYGVNHIDTAASYGEAELRIGPWMNKHRDKFFLATKTEERTYAGVMRELDESRRKLQSDVIDLYQMHVLSDEDGWQTAMGPGGALEAFLEARDKGIVRNIGVTGHGLAAPLFHLRSLEVHDFESVLLPWNYPMSLDPVYAGNFRKLTALCLERNTAVQIIKSLCRRPWPEGVKTRATWYQPLEEQEDIDAAVSFILPDERLFLSGIGDIGILPKMLQAVEKFSMGKSAPPSSAELEEMAKRLGMEPLFR